MSMDDRTALARSNAGMRLIAQLTLFNKNEFDRLLHFIAQGYDDAALAAQSAADRQAALRQLQTDAGRLRVYQVLAVDKHRVAVLLQAQAGDAFYYCELAVGEDYPHKIIEYKHERMIEDTP